MSFRSAIKFLSLLSFSKIWNATKLYLNFFFSRFSPFRNLKHQAFSLSIEPCNYCDLRCPECPVGMGNSKSKKAVLTAADFSRWIKDFPKSIIHIAFYFQGEPLLNKEIDRLIHLAVKRKIWTSLSTNAQALDADMAERLVLSGLHQLIISVDGYDEESYQKYRIGGSFQQCMEAFSHLQKAKKKQQRNFPQIIAQQLVFKYNENQLQESRKAFKKAGADKVVFKSPQFYNYDNALAMMAVNPKYQRYSLKNGKLEQKRKKNQHCFRIWSSAVITQDGYLLPCCYDKDANYPFGNLNKEAFQQIWNNKKMRTFRDKQRKGEISICENCNG
jgi:radical SAM protein with 4Fe4S-binding SPASM domain